MGENADSRAPAASFRPLPIMTNYVTRSVRTDRVTFTTGAMRIEPDRRHLTLPVIGTVCRHENTRRVERLIAKGQARVMAIAVRRNGTRLDASVRILLQRPQQP
jgi:putative transposase